jgi:hypothetical protein
VAKVTFTIERTANREIVLWVWVGGSGCAPARIPHNELGGFLSDVIIAVSDAGQIHNALHPNLLVGPLIPAIRRLLDERSGGRRLGKDRTDK